MNQQLSRSVSAPFQASERQVLIKYWQDLQTKNEQVALMRKIENWKIANSNDQGFHQPPSPTNSPKKTLFPVSFDSSDDEKDVSSDSIDSGQELPSYVSFDQEKFADFSVFNQSFSVDVRRKSDSSENSSSLSGSSGIGERTTSSGSEARKSPPPQISVKYDAIAQLDLEMKIHQRKQENTYRRSVKPAPKQFTPLTTGQQIFGVAPMNTYRKTKTLNRNVSLPTLPEGIPASNKHPFYPKRNSHHVLQRVQSSFGMQSSNLMFK